MGTNSALISEINANIVENENGDITGTIMNTTLQDMVSTLGGGAQYMGVAIPSTDPGTPDGKVWYSAVASGTYTNFGGIIIYPGEECALINSSGSWVKVRLGWYCPEATQTELEAGAAAGAYPYGFCAFCITYPIVVWYTSDNEWVDASGTPQF